jgi:hypothetical protein
MQQSHSWEANGSWVLKQSTFYWIIMLITVLTAVRCYSVSRARWMQFILPHLKLILILLLCEVSLLLNLTDCTVTWMLSRQLLTVEARIQTYGIHMRFMVDKLLMGQIFFFLWALRFSSASYYFKNFRYVPSSGDGRIGPFKTTVLRVPISPISAIKLSNRVTCRSDDTSS